MIVEDFSLKKKYSFIRFGYEMSLLFFIIFLITCIDRKFGLIELIILSLSIVFLLLSLLKINFLHKIQLLFNKFFYLLSRIINPILMIIVYIFSIIPVAIMFKIKKLFTKEKAKDSYWNKVNKKINFNEQF